MRIAAAILAGGKATRMAGARKGFLPAVSGDLCLGHAIKELTKAGIADIIISANDPQPYRSFQRPIVADRYEGIGPMGGIEAAITELAHRCDGVVLLACDLPNVTRDEILLLMDAFEAEPDCVAVAHTSEGDQPLCAIVPVGVLPETRQAIAAGEHGVGKLWRTLGAKQVEIADPSRLINVNTLEELRAWLDRLRRAEEE